MNQELLIKARERDVKARKAAEQLLELKSIELYNSMSKLAKANLELEASLAREKELGQLKSSFVAVASHQFRTPLAIIQSNSELLEMMNRMTVKQSGEKYSKVSKRIKVFCACRIHKHSTVGMLRSRVPFKNPGDFGTCRRLCTEGGFPHALRVLFK